MPSENTPLVPETELLDAARELVSGSTPPRSCEDPDYHVPAHLWLTLQGEVMERLRALARADCNAIVEQRRATPPAAAEIAQPATPEPAAPWFIRILGARAWRVVQADGPDAVGDDGIPAFQISAAAPATMAAKPLDDPHLQHIFGWAIDGAMAAGYQNTNPPPDGHWLAPWWQRGRNSALANEAMCHSETSCTCHITHRDYCPEHSA